MLPQCGHFFHPQCISPWLKEKKDNCLLCQTKVSVQDNGEQQKKLHEDVAIRIGDDATSLTTLKDK